MNDKYTPTILNIILCNELTASFGFVIRQKNIEPDLSHLIYLNSLNLLRFYKY